MNAKPYSLCALAGLVLVSTLREAGGQADTVPPPRSAQLQVLDRFLGTWNTEMTNKVSVWNPKEQKSTGTATFVLSLNGRFLQSKGLSEPGKVEDLQIMTYDAEAKEYLSWFFNSLGIFNGPVPGQWDEAAKTMTWKNDLGNGVTSLNPVRFVDKDTIEWRLTVKDKEGKLLLDMNGKLTRKK